MVIKAVVDTMHRNFTQSLLYNQYSAGFSAQKATEDLADPLGEFKRSPYLLAAKRGRKEKGPDGKGMGEDRRKGLGRE